MRGRCGDDAGTSRRPAGPYVNGYDNNRAMYCSVPDLKHGPVGRVGRAGRAGGQEEPPRQPPSSRPRDSRGNRFAVAVRAGGIIRIIEPIILLLTGPTAARTVSCPRIFNRAGGGGEGSCEFNAVNNARKIAHLKSQRILF